VPDSIVIVFRPYNTWLVTRIIPTNTLRNPWLANSPVPTAIDHADQHAGRPLGATDPSGEYHAEDSIR
jgi:hypothetical protein